MRRAPGPVVNARPRRGSISKNAIRLGRWAASPLLPPAAAAVLIAGLRARPRQNRRAFRKRLAGESLYLTGPSARQCARSGAALSRKPRGRSRGGGGPEFRQSDRRSPGRSIPRLNHVPRPPRATRRNFDKRPGTQRGPAYVRTAACVGGRLLAAAGRRHSWESEIEGAAAAAPANSETRPSVRRAPAP